MKKKYPLYIFCFFCFALTFESFAQPANYYMNPAFGPDGQFSANTPVNGIVRRQFQSFNTSNTFYIEWDGQFNEWFNTSINLNQEFTLTFQGLDGLNNTSVINSGILNSTFYTIQINGFAYSDRQAVIMETDNAPITFGGTPVSPASPSVFPSQDLDLTITLSGNKSTQERAFVRYSDNGYATSEVVEVSFATSTASSGTATIPGSYNTAGKNVSFYVYTTTVAATSSSNHDLISLNLANNGGSNYVYTVASSWTTSGGSLNFNDAAAWDANEVPPANQVLTIEDDLNLNTNYTTSSITVNPGRTLTINSGQTLTMTGGITGAGALTVDGTLQLNAGGSTSIVPSYNTGGTLTYNTGGPYGQSTEWPSSNGPTNVTISNSGTNVDLAGSRSISGTLTIDSGTEFDLNTHTLTLGGASTLTRNGTFTASTGTVVFDGAATVTNSVIFNNATLNAANIDLNGSTVNGTLRLNSGGSLAGSSAVVYGGSGILSYQTGGTPTAADEWPAGSGPNSVVIGNNTALTLPFSRSSAGITIDSGSSLTVGNAQTLTMTGGITGAGALTVDGTLQLNASGSTSIVPTYTSGSTLIYNTGGIYGRFTEWSTNNPHNVQLSNNTTLNLGANGGTGTARTITGDFTVDSGSALSLNINAMTQALTVQGNFLNNGTVTLSNSGGGDLILEGNFNDNGTFNANGRAVFFQGNATQTINSTTNPLDIDVMRINKSGGEVVMAQNLLLDQTNDPLEFNNGSSFLNLGNFTLTIGVDGTTSNITYNGGAFRGTTGSTLTIEGDGTLGGGLVFDPAFDDLGTLNISRANSGLVSVNSNLDVAGNINISQGTLELSAADNLNGNLVLDGGNFSTGATNGHTETLGTLDVQASGTINLGSGVHSLNFANSSAVAWDGAAVLTINNWSGTSGTSGAGTAGSIFVGAGGLSSGQLANIQFSGYPQGAVLTGSGEVVPELALIPGTNASNMIFTEIGRTQMTIVWTDGNGNDRMVVVRANNEVDFNPLNGTNYTPNTDFTAGTGFGPSNDNKVVYNSADIVGIPTSFVTVTGLSAGTTYHVAIFEYNGDGPTQSYLIPGHTGSQATTTTFLTVSSGSVNWSDTAAWFDGSVPGVNDNVDIRTNMVLDVNAQLTNLNISTGSLTVNSAQTLTIAGGGSFSNNGSFTDTAGTLVFSGAATVSGSGTFTLNNLTINGGVEFPSSYVVNGMLTLNANSFVQNNSPNYGPNSTLIYNSGNAVENPYGRRSEWSNTGAFGNPVDVIIQNNTAVDLGFVIRNVEAVIAADLTIESGSSLFMDFGSNDMSAALVVQGNFINNGTLSLSDAVGGDLKVRGNYTQNGTLNNNGRAVFFDGAGAQTATGTSLPLTFDYLRIDKSETTLSFEEDVVVTQINGGTGYEQTDGIVTIVAGKSLTVQNGGNFDIDAGTFTLESESTTYSSLIVNNVTNSGGNIRYNRFTNVVGSGTTGGNDLVAAPLSGQRFDAFATANNGILTASNDLRAFAIFDNAANPGAFVNYNVVSDAAVTLAAGVGYRAATDTGDNLLFDGSVSTGNVNVAITSEAGTFGEWNLIGNPYPSYISIADFLNHEETSGTSNIDLMLSASAGIYGYDGAATDGWDVINLANAGSRLMAPGQGFFVTASGNVSLQFTPAMRRTGSSDDFIANRNSDDLTYLRLRAASGTKAYHTEIYFNDNASLGLDPGYDSKVLDINVPTFLLYSHLVEDNSGLPIALQSVNTTDLTEVRIPLGVHANAGEAISFSLTENTLSGATEVYLEDMVTQTFTLLTNESYVVTPSVNLNGTGRFFLRIGNDVLSNPDNEFDRLHIYTLPDTRELVIAGVLNNATTAMVYDLQGREVHTQVLATGVSNQSMDVSHLGTGVYIVTLNNAVGRKTQKVILK